MSKVKNKKEVKYSNKKEQKNYLGLSWKPFVGLLVFVCLVLALYFAVLRAPLVLYQASKANSDVKTVQFTLMQTADVDNRFSGEEVEIDFSGFDSDFEYKKVLNGEIDIENKKAVVQVELTDAQVNGEPISQRYSYFYLDDSTYLKEGEEFIKIDEDNILGEDLDILSFEQLRDLVYPLTTSDINKYENRYLGFDSEGNVYNYELIEREGYEESIKDLLIYDLSSKGLSGIQHDQINLDNLKNTLRIKSGSNSVESISMTIDQVNILDISISDSVSFTQTLDELEIETKIEQINHDIEFDFDSHTQE